MPSRPLFNRRWMQFSLRGLLLATLIAAMGLAPFMPGWQYARRQRAVAAMVDKYGGLIRYDFDSQRLNELPSPNRPNDHRFVRQVLGDDYFDTALEVQLGNGIVLQYAVSNVTGTLEQQGWKRVDGTLADDDFKVIVTLNRLRVLRIPYSAVTDSAASQVDSLIDLEELELGASGITDRLMDRIVRLPKLRRLTLRSPGITDASVEQIGSMKALEELDLGGSRMTREGFNRLHELLPKTWISH